jgi:ribosomal protein L15
MAKNTSGSGDFGQKKRSGLTTPFLKYNKQIICDLLHLLMLYQL